MPRFVVFDFDGTVTHSEAEGALFTEPYLEQLAGLTGLPLATVRDRSAALQARMLAEPGAWPFWFDGRAVAPACVDPYLRMSAVAEHLFDEVGAFRDGRDRGRLLGGLLYPLNYARTVEHPVFRDEAADVFAALRDAGLAIVTNSKTTHVAEKIRRLGERVGTSLAWLAERARGDARKFVIDDGFTDVPAGLQVPGLERPVLLRRRSYHEVLDALRREQGAVWTEGWVVGDIFELDLALPLALGMNVVLVAGPSTPAYERAFVDGARGPDGARRGYVVSSLGEVLELLGAGA